MPLEFDVLKAYKINKIDEGYFYSLEHHVISKILIQYTHSAYILEFGNTKNILKNWITFSSIGMEMEIMVRYFPVPLFWLGEREILGVGVHVLILGHAIIDGYNFYGNKKLFFFYSPKFQNRASYPKNAQSSSPIFYQIFSMYFKANKKRFYSVLN